MATRTVALVRMNRWAILAGYGLLAGSTQLLWLTYAPITGGLYTMLYGEFVGLYRRNRKAHARLNGPGGSA